MAPQAGDGAKTIWGFFKWLEEKPKSVEPVKDLVCHLDPRSEKNAVKDRALQSRKYLIEIFDAYQATVDGEGNIEIAARRRRNTDIVDIQGQAKAIKKVFSRLTQARDNALKPVLKAGEPLPGTLRDAVVGLFDLFCVFHHMPDGLIDHWLKPEKERLAKVKVSGPPISDKSKFLDDLIEFLRPLLLDRRKEPSENNQMLILTAREMARLLVWYKCGKRSGNYFFEPVMRKYRKST
ncbi:MAG: hypothetical protein LBC63_08340 [Holophagales bacterium]|nr:hypothetical protein [Holophagales bacterium]